MTEAAEQNLTRFRLNGTGVEVAAEPGERLSETLRERLGARDVKIGCNAGDCGACSVLIDGQVVCACLTPTRKAEGRQVETVAGLVAADPVAQALAQRFQDHGAAQCGFCTPGMMTVSVALLRADPAPDEAAITRALGGLAVADATFGGAVFGTLVGGVTGALGGGIVIGGIYIVNRFGTGPLTSSRPGNPALAPTPAYSCP